MNEIVQYILAHIKNKVNKNLRAAQTFTNISFFAQKNGRTRTRFVDILPKSVLTKYLVIEHLAVILLIKHLIAEDLIVILCREMLDEHS